MRRRHLKRRVKLSKKSSKRVFRKGLRSHRTHRTFKKRVKLSKKSSKRVFRNGLRSHRNNRRSARGGFVL